MRAYWLSCARARPSGVAVRRHLMRRTGKPSARARGISPRVPPRRENFSQKNFAKFSQKFRDTADQSRRKFLKFSRPTGRIRGENFANFCKKFAKIRLQPDRKAVSGAEGPRRREPKASGPKQTLSLGRSPRPGPKGLSPEGAKGAYLARSAR